MKNNILKDIISFSEKVKNSKLNSTILESKDDYMLRVDSYLQTSRIQSIVIVAVFDLNSRDKTPSQADLAKHFKCNPMELFIYKDEIWDLEKRGLLENDNNPFYIRNEMSSDLSISKELRSALITHKPFVKKKEAKFSAINFIEKTGDIIHDQTRNRITVPELLNTHKRMMHYNRKQPIVTYFNKLFLSTEDLLAFIYILFHNLDGCNRSDVAHVSKGIFEDKAKCIRFEESIVDGSNDLIKCDYIKLNEGDFFSSASVSLTPKAKNELATFNVPIRLRIKEKEFNLTETKSISRKKLFYNALTKTEIDTITNSLKPQKYKQISKALKKEGLKTGVCTLFYGTPGTGKTESVYQIAKTTGRAIWKVDLSELKSMWFGESQKLVKGLFEDYATLCKTEKRTPILLLNEADAILGKRTLNAESSTGKAENAIQNIFLDCLEDFEGILFATTNLEESLDSAFERRFLFKIGFKRPTIETRAKIWKSKFKGLSQLMATYLASNYHFSGGEIDNIARKYKMTKVLHPNLDMKVKLVELCNSEKLNSKNVTHFIGFKNHG